MLDPLPRDFSMADRRKRRKLEYRGLPLRSAHEQILDFDVPIIRLDEDWAKFESARCIHYRDPAPCQKTCLAGNDIAYALWQIEH